MLYYFLKDYINEECSWHIFDYCKNSKDKQWETFDALERHYVSNKYTCNIEVNNEEIVYNEYVNYKNIISWKFNKGSLSWEILKLIDDRIMTFEEILDNVNSDQTRYSKESVFESLEELFKRGIVYYSDKLDEVVSVIDLEMI